MGWFGTNPPKNEDSIIYLESKNLHGRTAWNSVSDLLPYMLAPPTELYIYRPHALGLSTTPACLFSSFFSEFDIFLSFYFPFALGQKNKAMENKSTDSSKGGKSAKIPPPRGQVLFKMFERVKGAVAEKNSKARVQTGPDEGGSGSGSGSGSGNGGGSGSGGGNQ